MKLAFCLFRYFPFGGLQRDFLRIAKVCQERGHEIHIFTMLWEGEVEPGFQVHLIKPKGWQNHTQAHSFIDQVQDHLQKEKYDLVIGFNKMPGLDVYYAADVCYQARIKNKRGFLSHLLPRSRQLIKFESAVFSKGKNTDILLISPQQQQEFVHYYATENHRFKLLPPGIAKDRIAQGNVEAIRNDIREIYQLNSEDILLLMVGSGFKTKGLDRAILALASLPAALKNRCQLMVIGQDKPHAFLKLAKKNHVDNRVHFLGGRSDVPHFLLAADFLLHPAYHENTGTVLLEALTSGLPVLTVDVCGYAKYIRDAEAGVVLASPFEQSKLNQALLAMLTSSQRKKWQANALRFAKETDLYSMPEKAVDFFETSVNKQNTRLSPQTNFEYFMAMQGEIFRHQEGRKTQRVAIEGKNYFIKQHTGVGWKEIIKNLIQLRLPVVSAKNEWLAIEKLQALNIPVPAIMSYGKQGKNPAKLQSFILMQELDPVISLEDLTKQWQQESPHFSLKRKLIAEVARMIRTLHVNGINHRDCYLCHFLLDLSTPKSENVKLYVIDLHRAQIRRNTPKRWVIKDLAGLYFSSLGIGLTERDYYRFMQYYCKRPLRDVMLMQRHFWKKVKKQGEQIL